MYFCEIFQNFRRCLTLGVYFVMKGKCRENSEKLAKLIDPSVKYMCKE